MFRVLYVSCSIRFVFYVFRVPYSWCLYVRAPYVRAPYVRAPYVRALCVRALYAPYLSVNHKTDFLLLFTLFASSLLSGRVVKNKPSGKFGYGQFMVTNLWHSVNISPEI